MRYGIIATASTEASNGSLGMVVALVLSVGLAYLLTHFVVDRLQKRWLFITGVEYVILGLLFGPLVPIIPAFHDLTPLAPIIALGAGWIGLSYGTTVRFKEADGDPDMIRVAFIEVVGTGAAVAFASYQLLTIGSGLLVSLQVKFDASGLAFGPSLEKYSYTEALIVSLVLGCVAAARSGSACKLVTARYKLKGGITDFLLRAGRFGDVVAITAFGLLFCIFHQGESLLNREVSWADWVLMTQILGGGLGLLFGFFLGAEDTKHGHNRFLALVGIISFASGAAFFLNLSSLLVNLVLGIVLANTTKAGREVTSNLEASERPLRLLLLVFAGALLKPVPVVATALLIVSFLAVRTLAKLLMGYLGTMGLTTRRDIARGLFAQGSVAIAMALSFQVVYDGPLVDMAYAAIVTSVIINELIAPRLLRSLLVDAGEISGEPNHRTERAR